MRRAKGETEAGDATHPCGTLQNLKSFLRAIYTGAVPMIDRQLAGFLEEGVGIHLGTCNARLEPQGMRALAVTVDPDGSHLTVYLAAVAATRLIPDLEANGRAAVSFGRPVDDRACQVKGEFVSARDVDGSERAIVETQWNGFRASLDRIGIPRALTAEWTMWPATAVRLRVTALFEQTPGPGAGAPIA
jgi:hypothetical protein